jgi:hypothetical protein
LSNPKVVRLSKSFFVLVSLLLTTMVGCWEQWSNDWFPQMKWQKAVQAFEVIEHNGQRQGFIPPEGTIPIGGIEPLVSNVIDSASDHLVNPRPVNLASLQNGQLYFERYCLTCHGSLGMGDGPVSAPGAINGPFQGVLPLIVANARSDGHVYTTIRSGRRRMPSYKRIAAADRWDIVNYIRYLNNPTGSLQ